MCTSVYFSRKLLFPQELLSIKLFPVPSGLVSKSRRQAGAPALGVSGWTAQKLQK